MNPPFWYFLFSFSNPFFLLVGFQFQIVTFFFEKAIEKLLPGRPPVIPPAGEHVEEVDLHDYDVNERRDGGSGPSNAYDSDDEEGGHSGPGVQCAHQ